MVCNQSDSLSQHYIKYVVEGIIRYKKNGKYIDLAPDGTIISFGKQWEIRCNMALIHEFTIIEKDSSVNFIENGMDKIDVSDNLILYMGDSLRWIETSWNSMQTTKKGLNYYGYTIIKDDNTYEKWIYFA